MANTLVKIVRLTGTTSGLGTFEDVTFVGGTILSKMFLIAQFGQGSPIAGASKPATHSKSALLIANNTVRIYSGVTPNAPTPYHFQIVCFSAASDMSVFHLGYAWATNAQNNVFAAIPRTTSWLNFHGLVTSTAAAVYSPKSCPQIEHWVDTTIQTRSTSGANPEVGSAIYCDIVNWGNADLASRTAGTMWLTPPATVTITDPLNTPGPYWLTHVRAMGGPTGGVFTSKIVQTDVYSDGSPVSTIHRYRVDAVNTQQRYCIGARLLWDAAKVLVTQQDVYVFDPNVSANLAITAVDMNRTVVFPDFSVGGINVARSDTSGSLGTGDFRDIAGIVELTSPIQLTATRGAAGAGAEFAGFGVVTWEWLGEYDPGARAFYYRKMGQG